MPWGSLFGNILGSSVSGALPSPEAILKARSLHVALFYFIFFPGVVVLKDVNCKTGRGSDTRQRY